MRLGRPRAWCSCLTKQVRTLAMPDAQVQLCRAPGARSMLHLPPSARGLLGGMVVGLAAHGLLADRGGVQALWWGLPGRCRVWRRRIR